MVQSFDGGGGGKVVPLSDLGPKVTNEQAFWLGPGRPGLARDLPLARAWLGPGPGLVASKYDCKTELDPRENSGCIHGEELHQFSIMVLRHHI